MTVVSKLPPEQLSEQAVLDELDAHKSTLGRMVHGQFEFRTLEEAHRLSTMLACQFPDPDKVSTGIWELLANAVEHGNLEIDFQRKSELLQQGDYFAEIGRRLRLPRFAGRLVSVEFRRTQKHIRIRVRDGGPGFDFARYLDASSTPTGPNGRGILIATQLSFDRVIYRGRGNVVDAVVHV